MARPTRLPRPRGAGRLSQKPLRTGRARAPCGEAARGVPNNAPFNLLQTALEAAARRGGRRVRLLGRARAARPLLVGGRELLARAPHALRRRLHTLGRAREYR